MAWKYLERPKNSLCSNSKPRKTPKSAKIPSRCAKLNPPLLKIIKDVAAVTVVSIKYIVPRFDLELMTLNFMTRYTPIKIATVPAMVCNQPTELKVFMCKMKACKHEIFKKRLAKFKFKNINRYLWKEVIMLDGKNGWVCQN